MLDHGKHPIPAVVTVCGHHYRHPACLLLLRPSLFCGQRAPLNPPPPERSSWLQRAPARPPAAGGIPHRREWDNLGGSREAQRTSPPCSPSIGAAPAPFRGHSIGTASNRGSSPPARPLPVPLVRTGNAIIAVMAVTMLPTAAYRQRTCDMARASRLWY